MCASVPSGPGKDWREVEIVNRAMVLATDDKPAARNLFRAAFAPYYATPVYNRFLAWAGHGDVAATIAEGWAAKDRAKTTGALSDELIDEIAVIGTEDEIRARIQEAAAGGVHTHIVAPHRPVRRNGAAHLRRFHRRALSVCLSRSASSPIKPAVGRALGFRLWPVGQGY